MMGVAVYLVAAEGSYHPIFVPVSIFDQPCGSLPPGLHCAVQKTENGIVPSVVFSSIHFCEDPDFFERLLDNDYETVQHWNRFKRFVDDWTRNVLS